MNRPERERWRELAFRRRVILGDELRELAEIEMHAEDEREERADHELDFADE